MGDACGAVSVNKPGHPVVYDFSPSIGIAGQSGGIFYELKNLLKYFIGGYAQISGTGDCVCPIKCAGAIQLVVGNDKADCGNAEGAELV